MTNHRASAVGFRLPAMPHTPSVQILRHTRASPVAGSVVVPTRLQARVLSPHLCRAAGPCCRGQLTSSSIWRSARSQPRRKIRSAISLKRRLTWLHMGRKSFADGAAAIKIKGYKGISGIVVIPLPRMYRNKASDAVGAGFNATPFFGVSCVWDGVTNRLRSQDGL